MTWMMYDLDPVRCREACLDQIERGNTFEADGSGSGPGGTAVNYRQLASDLELLQVSQTLALM